MARRRISKALHTQILAYGTALVTDAIALLITLLLQPLLAPTVFALFYPAVMISSLSGGLGPGIFATALAAIATILLWLPLPNSLDPTTLNYWVRLIVLIGVALMICGLSSRYRRAKQQAEQIAQKLHDSQELFESFMKHSPVTAFIKDEAGRYLYVNPLAERLFNRELYDWVGKTDFDLCPAELAQQLRANDTRVLTTGQVLEVLEIEPQDDGDRYFMSFKFPLHSSVGHKLLAGMSLEITDYRKTQAALRESEARFNCLVESNLLGFVAWDFQGNITDANAAFLQMVGYTQEDLQAGKLQWKDMTPPEWRWLDERASEEFAKTREYTPYEKEFIRKDGSRVPVLVGGVLLENSQGRGVSFVFDLTEQKRTGAALRQSEEQFRQLADAMPQIVWVANANGEKQYVNQQWRDYSGLTLEETDDRAQITQIYHPDDARRIQEQWIISQTTGVPYQVECRLKRASDGVYRWFLVRAVPIKNKQGEITHWYGTSTDIDDRKRAEEALRQSEAIARSKAEELAAFMQITPVALWIAHDPNCHHITANQAAYNLVRQTPGSVITATPAHSSDPLKFKRQKNGQEISPHDLPMQRAATTGEEVTDEMELVFEDGTIRFIYGKATPLRNDTGDVRGVIAAFVDMTDHKQAQQEREQLLARERAARKEAEAANRIKDEFLAVLSHELRSPLSPILGWTKLLQTRKFDEQTTQRALETIERNAKLQTQLIEDLLDVSRILQGKMVFNVSPVNLVSAIAAALETVQLAAEAKGIELRFEVREEDAGMRGQGDTGTFSLSTSPSGFGSSDLREIAKNLTSSPHLPNSTFSNLSASRRLPITASSFSLSSELIQVAGDSSRLQQIVWNLLSNAVKFTPAGGRIEIWLERVGMKAQIQVKDNGKGITPEFLPYIFDYFRQEDSKITRKFGGLGLGLAIVQYLTELHGGTVKAESPGEGQGATFTVELPLLLDEGSIPDENPSLPLTYDSSCLIGLKLLVVDDEAAIRELTLVILEQAGAEVTVAASAAEALAALDRCQFDVLVSDIGMPDIDGYMLINQVRRRSPEQGGKIPAIALTAYAGEIDQQQALFAGFQQHLTKPIVPSELVAAIVELVRLKVLSAE
ncbi:hypothetical protein A6770_20185 [Nostoc minutum NIES-26]|uniref:histidine kinase n=1 Tax=Nostoc minutum NIES-26 TaxID=1844469 RepID=A0A367R5V8_9NOSO|nr:hypothetical protein A6770_20185 [Nostoc minutum NIES-26]